MSKELFEISVLKYYKFRLDIFYIKYYYDPSNYYSVSIHLEQFPTEKNERVKVQFTDQVMRGSEIDKFLMETKKKLRIKS